ncbi:TPM domain-containing protein [Zeaxanthinibacter sp. PT1]|uniref:TPM domain-containing protein n=1 Tax=Zeaxanthinibacter TaxID=561554 RepID=UPI002349FCF4|nr:TPM domain-containing protein [Zeaxanthinibacter sp. PT1]MDC6351277.1 TPM domain-containing protein [Zeaxanthinibacter sp. PT1]
MHDEVEEFLSPEEEQAIVQAILQAEQKTSGEIRVHLEPHTDQDHFERAKEIFHSLKMDNTRERNGVLIYVAVADHKFVILGDKGIDQMVPEDFWESTRDIIQQHFKKGAFRDGLVAGILNAGQELKAHFPYDPDNRNELTNEVSKG